MGSATLVPEVARHDCESEEERAADVRRVLELAIASIRTAEPRAVPGCADPAPFCAAADDGSRCVYRLQVYPDFFRLTLHPRASDGAVVAATAFVNRSYEEPAPHEPQLEPRRWGVRDRVRCRGDHQQRSYGPGSTFPLTVASVGVTCWNESDADVPVRVLAVRPAGRRPSTVEVVAFEPSILTAAAETQIQISTAPIELPMRDTTPIEVRLRVGSAELVTIADVTTPERFPLRR